MTAWLDTKLNSSGRTKQVDDDSLVTMVMGLGSISFLLLDDDELPVWDWQRLRVNRRVKNIDNCFFFFWRTDRLGYSQLDRRPRCRALPVWRTRASRSLDDMEREDSGFASPTQPMKLVLFTCDSCISTSVELVYDGLQPLLEGDGVGGTLECKAKLSILYPPVMEDGVHLVVHQPPLHRTLQHRLKARTATS